MKRSRQRWAFGLALLFGAGISGEVSGQGEFPQPAPGALPDLRPPPGVQITRDAFESLMRKPFNDDWETPPWERKAPKPPAPGERVFGADVLEEPAPVERAEVIVVPERVGDGVILPPLRRPEVRLPAPEEPALIFEKNPYEARARAVEEGKFMMLAFVGTNWNSASRQLSWEVFNDPEFIQFATESMVPCFLDFPNKLESDSPLRKFKEHYGIGGLPSVVLFDSEGTPFVKKSGYLSKSGGAYLTELKALVGQREALMKSKRKELETDGYRTWTNLAGRTFFGKVIRVQAGEVYFEDAAGKPAKVAVEKLSAPDRVRLGL